MPKKWSVVLKSFALFETVPIIVLTSVSVVLDES